MGCGTNKEKVMYAWGNIYWQGRLEVSKGQVEYF